MKKIGKKLKVWIADAVGVIVFGTLIGFAYCWLAPPAHMSQGFIITEKYKPTEEELLRGYKGQLRPIRIRILRELNRFEYSRIIVKGNIPSDSYTMFEALIIDDYTSEIKVKRYEKIDYMQAGTFERQRWEDPPLTAGQEYVILAINHDSEYWGAYLGETSTFDIVQTPVGEFLYKRGIPLSLPQEPMRYEEHQRLTSSPKNPAVYSQKVRLEDLLQYLYEKQRVNKAWLKDDRGDLIRFWIGAVSVFVTILGSLVIASRIWIRRSQSGTGDE